MRIIVYCKYRNSAHEIGYSRCYVFLFGRCFRFYEIEEQGAFQDSGSRPSITVIGSREVQYWRIESFLCFFEMCQGRLR